MESQQNKDENLFSMDHKNDFSSGPLASAPEKDEDEKDDLDEEENEQAADDELDEEV